MVHVRSGFGMIDTTNVCNIINAPETDDHSAITLHLKTEDLLQPNESSWCLEI